MRTPHAIPYQGSKRRLAHCILPFFPEKFDRLIEPFAGSAAISIAAAFHRRASRFILNDINKPLAHLLEMVISNPLAMADAYQQAWHNQAANPLHYYHWIRRRFNATRQPGDLLFLLARCIKSAVRYNVKGHFNQSPDKRLQGRNPEGMQADLLQISRLLKGKTRCYASDYQEVLPVATENDLLYLDPPYEGTGLTGGFSYAGKVQAEEFAQSLARLNERNIPYLLSFNGRTGTKSFGSPLPPALGLTKIEINTGQSPQATLLRRVAVTYESLYLSPALTAKIDLKKVLQVNSEGINPYTVHRRKGRPFCYELIPAAPVPETHCHASLHQHNFKK